MIFSNDIIKYSESIVNKISHILLAIYFQFDHLRRGDMSKVTRAPFDRLDTPI